MTSVIGHLTGLNFERPFRGWESCPPGTLFDAPVCEEVDSVCNSSPNDENSHLLMAWQEKEGIAQNIKDQARSAKILFIWTDCDREGEYIGSEVRQQARKTNPRIEVKRARFSNTERAYVKQNLLLLPCVCSSLIQSRITSCSAPSRA
jgi:DNA topoisomerase III